MPVASTPMSPVPVPWPQPLRYTQVSHTEQIPVFPVPCSSGLQADLATPTAFLQTYRKAATAERGGGNLAKAIS